VRLRLRWLSCGSRAGEVVREYTAHMHAQTESAEASRPVGEATAQRRNCLTAAG